MKLVAAVLLALVAVASAKVFFKETFDADWEKRWVTSNWKKSDGQAGDFKWSAGPFFGDAEADKGLQTSQDAKFYAASAKYDSFSNKGKTLVIQFQVRFPQKIDCGGGYIKILPAPLDQKEFNGDSKYNIMFGPDICGTSTKKVHVIFSHSGKNHLVKKEIAASDDQLSHVYTLIVNPDDSYEVRVDGEKKQSGKLADDWDFMAAKKIKDPSAKKPSDWVDNAKMDDPSDSKPADWDATPKEIPDPEATKPEDWNPEDGEWEAPMVPNPEYKGEWKAKQIDNPNYKGPWVHPEIDNPEYKEFTDLHAYSDFSYVGVDVWQVKAGTIFDNILIADSIADAEALMDATYKKNKDAEKAAFDDQEKAKREKEEAERKKAEEDRKKDEEKDKKTDDDEEDDDEDEKVGDKIKEKAKDAGKEEL